MVRLGMAGCLFALAACGSDVLVEDPSGPGASASSGSTVASSSSAGTSSSSGGTGGVMGGGGMGTGGAPSDATYAACFWAGGLDHIVVKKLDPAAGVCLRLHAAWPGGPGPFPDVQGNDGWAISDISLTADLTDCLNPAMGGPVGTSAEGATGTLYVPPSPPYPPPTMDVSVVATFDGLPPSIAAAHTIETAQLPLVYCN